MKTNVTMGSGESRVPESTLDQGTKGQGQSLASLREHLQSGTRLSKAFTSRNSLGVEGERQLPDSHTAGVNICTRGKEWRLHDQTSGKIMHGLGFPDKLPYSGQWGAA